MNKAGPDAFSDGGALPHTSYRDINDSVDDKQAASLGLGDERALSSAEGTDLDGEEVQAFRLYRRRFVGLVGLWILNFVGGMNWPWFGAIANDTAAQFDISLHRVNWLGNIYCCIYLPVAFYVPIACARYGIRACCTVGAVCLIIGSWIRYAATAQSLSVNSAYALLQIGQIFPAIAQPIFQILGPTYSEAWFNLKGRTTATMALAIANPIGSAIGQLISPLVGSVRHSILILGIISSIAAPACFLIQSSPPTPPTYSGSQQSPSMVTLMRVWLGLGTPPPGAHMSARERIDFGILFFLFGVMVAAVTDMSLLTAQYFQPVGYSSDTAGFLGATLLLAGIVAAVLTAPLFDRVLTHHLALSVKCLCPVLGIVWLCLIWATKPDNTAGLYLIMAVIGVASLTLLPVALELGCEVTRNAAGSSAAMWFSANLFSLIFLLSEDALRAGPDAHPPLNMHRALVFNGVFALGASATAFALRGRQARRERDEAREKASAARGAATGLVGVERRA